MLFATKKQTCPTPATLYFINNHGYCAILALTIKVKEKIKPSREEVLILEKSNEK